MDRAIRLWRAIADGSAPRTVQELSTQCAINRSTAWRLLGTLEHHGLVERDPVTQRYDIGYAVVRAAGVAGHDALARRMHPLLAAFGQEIGESVTLAVAERFSLLYVDQVDPPNVLAPSWQNRHIPLHASSGGKVLLAWLPREERDAVIPTRLERYTQTTITTHGGLESELARVRRDGFARSIGEYEEFMSGVSAPILDRQGRPQAVVNLWGPSARLVPERLEELGHRTTVAAAEMAALLAIDAPDRSGVDRQPDLA